MRFFPFEFFRSRFRRMSMRKVGVLNVVKAGAKRIHKGFQKIQPLLDKVKPIVNPRNALLGFLFM